ncbi:MAG TPA: 4-hydroxythreonine-4-phosphate dehydrogenase PdxA, partial [Edaphobacter sp.]|nr:4-hydroxythreonine-4-phosphate dehydrogenase PdxA [Edaphobacter sp.]
MTPIIAITMGDAAGVGPEIIVKALAHPEVYEGCRPVVIGDVVRLRQAQAVTASPVQIHPIASHAIDKARLQCGTLDC